MGRQGNYALAFLLFISVISIAFSQYQPTWDSLDKRPLPTWYDEAKIGVFMHWGVYSVPSFGGGAAEWFWEYWKGYKSKAHIEFMQKNYPPGFTYADFAHMFKAEFFDPNQWADILAASGIKYFVLTSKHHEGFTNWPSKYSFNWNSMDVGPKQDLVGALANAIRNRTDIKFGLYHSLFEWFNPLYLQDKANKFSTQTFVQTKVLPEMYELIKAYKPELIWSDGDWEAPWQYWNSTQFLAWLYNESPVKDTVVVNDRWGIGTTCKHGDYYTCSDRFSPGTLQKHKWENAMTVDKISWGYRRNAVLADIYKIEDLLNLLAKTISCGGNLLMNVGPTADGRIIPVFEERLRQTGAWLKVNGEAVYSSKPWTHQNDTLTPNVWFTSKKSASGSTSVYAFFFSWPSSSLSLATVTPASGTTINLLGYTGQISFTKRAAGGIDITLPTLTADQMPCQWGWVLKMENVTPTVPRKKSNWRKVVKENSVHRADGFEKGRL